MPLLKGSLKHGGATDSMGFARAIVAKLNSRLWTRQLHKGKGPLPKTKKKPRLTIAATFHT